MKPDSPFRDSVGRPVSVARSADVQADNSWGLVQDTLPPMEFSTTSAGESVRTDLAMLKAFPKSPVTVPANSHVHLLLDRRTLTTAYPILTVSGGKGARVRLTYSEALYDKQMRKGDRDEVGDRTAWGLYDVFLPDGGAHRVFEPLWWRTWRYLDMEIETGAEPLQMESLVAEFTAYPFEERARFQSGDAELDKIWDISWRTARLDAHETYMDTPYYEQLQYVGDTRIQALISYAVAGDDRLARQAIKAFDQSRIPEGITRSRYPSSLPQNIPTFSLLWVGMQYLGALENAADLEGAVGDSTQASRYRDRATHVRSGLYERCWSRSQELLADNPEQKNFSQQTNVLAVLYDVVPKDRQQEILRKMLDIEPGTTPDGVLSASHYFRFYLARALDHAGMGDEYLRSLDAWRKLLPMHFSTWPEMPGDTRDRLYAGWQDAVRRIRRGGS